MSIESIERLGPGAIPGYQDLELRAQVDPASLDLHCKLELQQGERFVDDALELDYPQLISYIDRLGRICAVDTSNNRAVAAAQDGFNFGSFVSQLLIRPEPWGIACPNLADPYDESLETQAQFDYIHGAPMWYLSTRPVLRRMVTTYVPELVGDASYQVTAQIIAGLALLHADEFGLRQFREDQEVAMAITELERWNGEW